MHGLDLAVLLMSASLVAAGGGGGGAAAATTNGTLATTPVVVPVIPGTALAPALALTTTSLPSTGADVKLNMTNPLTNPVGPPKAVGAASSSLTVKGTPGTITSDGKYETMLGADHRANAIQTAVLDEAVKARLIHDLAVQPDSTRPRGGPATVAVSGSTKGNAVSVAGTSLAETAQNTNSTSTGTAVSQAGLSSTKVSNSNSGMSAAHAALSSPAGTPALANGTAQPVVTPPQGKADAVVDNDAQPMTMIYDTKTTIVTNNVSATSDSTKPILINNVEAMMGNTTKQEHSKAKSSTMKSGAISLSAVGSGIVVVFLCASFL